MIIVEHFLDSTNIPVSAASFTHQMENDVQGIVKEPEVRGKSVCLTWKRVAVWTNF